MELSSSAKKILLVTPGQPSLNPRIVKEADCLAEAGFDVTVLYAYWNNWGSALDDHLFKEKKWKHLRVGGHPVEKPLTYNLSRLIHKLSIIISRYSSSIFFAEIAIARASFFLSRKVKSLKADLYIGHNLGALPAIVNAAHASQKPCAFDAEDFYRYDITDNDLDFSVILKSRIEDKYIPQVDYLTASSDGIGAAYQNLYKGKYPLTLLNVFPIAQGISVPKLNFGPTIKLFWFSQTISMVRGIADCVKALQHVKDLPIELHLLGTLANEVKEQILTCANEQIKVQFYDPVPPDQIVILAGKFDIGLALEDSKPLNRDICLTNKIFTYLQAGLAVIASDTTAQKGLINNNPGIGKIYREGDTQMLADNIRYFYDNRAELVKARQASYNAARSALNWEAESRKFLNLINNTLPA